MSLEDGRLACKVWSLPQDKTSTVCLYRSGGGCLAVGILATPPSPKPLLHSITAISVIVAAITWRRKKFHPETTTEITDVCFYFELHILLKYKESEPARREESCWYHKMDAPCRLVEIGIGASETSVGFYQTTRRSIPQDKCRNLRPVISDNFKYKLIFTQ